MTFDYPRQIRFHETDGAGVVYFAHVLTLCHEAYEASLAAAAIDLGLFFDPRRGAVNRSPDAIAEPCTAPIAVPIVHASIDFFRPMACGDRILIQLVPQRLPGRAFVSEFEIHYQLWPDRALPSVPSGQPPRSLAQATTRHVCIDAGDRTRTPLTPELERWLALWA